MLEMGHYGIRILIYFHDVISFLVWMRLSGGTVALRWPISRCTCCTSLAHRRASMTLLNSISNPSPVVFEEPAVMRGNRRIEQIAPYGLQPCEGPPHPLTQPKYISNVRYLKV